MKKKVKDPYVLKMTEPMCSALIDGITNYGGDDSLILDGRTRAALVRREMWTEAKSGSSGVGAPTKYGIAASHLAKFHIAREHKHRIERKAA
jgi:hypothetical protein